MDFCSIDGPFVVRVGVFNERPKRMRIAGVDRHGVEVTPANAWETGCKCLEALPTSISRLQQRNVSERCPSLAVCTARHGICAGEVVCSGASKSNYHIASLVHGERRLKEVQI